MLVERALTLYTQAGRVIYDLVNEVYRLRELAREPLPLDTLRFASPEEEEARKLVALHAMSGHAVEAVADGSIRLSAQAKQGDRQYQVMLRLDADERIVDGACQCNFFTFNRMHKGPCAHMLALRMSRQQAA